MKKTVFTLLTASSILFTAATTHAFEETTTIYAPMAESHSVLTAYSVQPDAFEIPGSVQQVSNSQATTKTGSFKLDYNSNIRLDAGTTNSIVTVAPKGSTAVASHQKSVGNEIWYKVTVNGSTGWILSTLMSPLATDFGTYTLKYNTNVRADAGTHNRILTVGSLGSSSKVTAQKTYGNETWYKVSINGTSGWVLSTLLTQDSTAVSTSTSTAISADLGSYSLKFNTNVRSDAGTHNRILTVGNAGSVTKVTAQKTNGDETWYQVSINGTTGWVLSTLLAPSNDTAAEIISIALSLQGIPYVFGGTTTKGFDCSAFTQYVFKKAGQSLTRTTLTQFAETKAVSNPQPGDLVFFANTYRPGISHVGIYLGNNEFVHAGGAKSEVRSLNESYWKSKFHSFRSK